MAREGKVCDGVSCDGCRQWTGETSLLFGLCVMRKGMAFRNGGGHQKLEIRNMGDRNIGRAPEFDSLFCFPKASNIEAF